MSKKPKRNGKNMNPTGEMFVIKGKNHITITDEIQNPFYRIREGKQPLSKVKKDLEEFLGVKLNLIGKRAPVVCPKCGEKIKG